MLHYRHNMVYVVFPSMGQVHTARQLGAAQPLGGWSHEPQWAVLPREFADSHMLLLSLSLLPILVNIRRRLSSNTDNNNNNKILCVIHASQWTRTSLQNVCSPSTFQNLRFYPTNSKVSGCHIRTWGAWPLYVVLMHELRIVNVRVAIHILFCKAFFVIWDKML